MYVLLERKGGGIRMWRRWGGKGGGGVEERRVARGVLRAEALTAGALHGIGGCFMSPNRADVTVH